jgi:CelD/BcsL family acetyltransferase involved in cellulose biosynthesis
VKTLTKTQKFQSFNSMPAAPSAPKLAEQKQSGELLTGPWRATPEVLLSVHDDLASLASVWKNLEKTGDCTAFQTFAFQSAWATHIGRASGAVPCVVVGWDAEAADEGNGPLFIMPFSLVKSVFGTKLVWMGAGVADYQGPLLAKSFGLSVRRGQFKALWNQILGVLPEHDVVELTSMPAKIGGQANPFMQLDSLNQHASSAHMTRLAPTWDEYYDAKRSSGSKRRDRQKRRKIEEFGAVELIVQRDEASIVETVETLIAQKSVAFARMGVTNMFDKPGMRDFYTALATDAEADGLIEVTQLRVGDAVAAANWGISFKGRFHYVMTSYDQEAVFANRGPGMIQLMALMQNATETGHTEFDFTVGDEGYKGEWCEIETQLFDHVAATTLRGLLIRLPKTSFLKVKRFIKQTPLLWEAFTRLRAVAGNLPGARAVRA